MTTVVDVFCGAGGLTHGFVREGFEVVAGIDSDESCRYPYEANNPGARFVPAKLEDLSAADLQELFAPDAMRILVGCAPCQPFSTYTKRLNNGNWQLVEDFAKLIAETLPEIISMENVPELQTYLNGRVFKRFVELLEPHYHLNYQVIYGPDYGIPQTRKRLVVLGSRLGPIALLPPTHDTNHYPTVRQSIASLPAIDAGEIHDADPLHRSRALRGKNVARIRQSRPGGTWNDWDDELVAECHKKDTGKYYSSVYGRMVWDEPAPTITTQAFSYGGGRFGHPEQHRALSLREMALLQTFPHYYKFVDPKNPDYSFERIGRKIGNAVPVTLAEHIARSIAAHLDECQ